MEIRVVFQQEKFFEGETLEDCKKAFAEWADNTEGLMSIEWAEETEDFEEIDLEYDNI